MLIVTVEGARLWPLRPAVLQLLGAASDAGELAIGIHFCKRLIFEAGCSVSQKLRGMRLELEDTRFEMRQEAR